MQLLPCRQKRRDYFRILGLYIFYFRQQKIPFFSRTGFFNLNNSDIFQKNLRCLFHSAVSNRQQFHAEAA